MNRSNPARRRPKLRWLALGVSAASLAAASRRRSTRIRSSLASDAVAIERDRLWIPTIRARSRDDALIGLGFAVASDRLWQMDLLRRAAYGRLSEIAGTATLPSDRMMRLIDMPSIVDACLKATSEDGQLAMEAYSDGVNLCMRRRSLPLEFRIMRYRPEPWAPRDCVAIVRLMGWIMGRMHESDLVAEELTAVLGREWSDALLLGATAASEPPDAAGTRAAHVTRREASRGNAVAASNAWAIDAARSVTGAPILASDPHLAYTYPSLWYEVNIEAPGFTVAGVAIPGLPGIGIGRTPTFAWGFTASMITQSLVYRETLSDDGTGVLNEDGFVPLTTRTERIAVRGESAELLTVRATPRGPLLSDLEPQASGQQFSLHWAGVRASAEIDGILRLNSASTLDEGLGAREFVAVPPFNIVAADARGQIECVTLGALHNLSPRPGFQDPATFPPPELAPDLAPRERDPEAGFVANSNNRVASPIAGGDRLRAKWEPGYRVDRIRERLASRSTHSPAEMQVLQADCHSLHAAALVPIIIAYIDGHAPAWAVAELAAWDYVTTADSRATLLFESFYNRWALAILAERLPSDLVRGILWAISAEAQFAFFDRILRGELPQWIPSPGVAEMARTVFNDMLAWLEERLGSDRTTWNWGSVHRVSFRHPFAERGGKIERFSTVGPLPVGGDRSTIWMSWWDPEAPFSVLIGPSMRLVADLSQPDRLWIASTLGQRGTPLSRHSHDQTTAFLAGHFHPVPASRPRPWKTIVPH